MLNFLETRICKNKDCRNGFTVKRYDAKIFCSKRCAAHVNNIGRKHSRETRLKIANSISLTPVTILRSEIKQKLKPLLLPFEVESEELRRLYLDEKLSSGEIAKKFDVSVFRVIKKLKKYKIPRRTPVESNRVRFLRTPLTFNKKITLSLKEKELYTAGLMLYWAEGAKGNSDKVDLANSDPNIAKLFIKMLRQIYQVRESKFRASIYCYSNQDIKNLIAFWSRELKLPQDKFYKPYIQSNFNINKIGKMKYGVIHVIYGDRRLFMQIMRDIDIISRQIEAS